MLYEEDGRPSLRDHRRVIDIQISQNNLLLRILPEYSVIVILQYRVTEKQTVLAFVIR